MAGMWRLMRIGVVALLLTGAFLAGSVLSLGDTATPSSADAIQQDAVSLAGRGAAAVQDEPSDEMTKLCAEHMAEMPPAMEEMMNNMMSEMMRDVMR